MAGNVSPSSEISTRTASFGCQVSFSLFFFSFFFIQRCGGVRDNKCSTETVLQSISSRCPVDGADACPIVV